MRILNLVSGLFLVAVSATAFAGGRAELRVTEDVSHNSTLLELGVPVREALTPDVDYVSWTGAECNPESTAAHGLKTEQGLEVNLKKVTLGVGAKLHYLPEADLLQKSVYGTVSTKLW